MSRHLMAKMRRTAAHEWAEPVPYSTRHGINGQFDKPHDWQQHPPLDEEEFTDEDHPYYRYDEEENNWDELPPAWRDTPEFEWHPHWGETHVRYTIVPLFNDWEDDAPTHWRAIHSGSHLGQETPGFMKDWGVWYSGRLPEEEKRRRGVPPDVEGPLKDVPKPNLVGGGFATPEEAKDAIEAHFAEHYGGGHQSFDQNVTPDHPLTPPDDLNDFDYGDIFGEGRP